MDSEIIRFSFMEVIQAELDCLVEEWNTHRIRKCNMGDVKSGIPDELYYLGDFIDGWLKGLTQLLDNNFALQHRCC